jgi:hypothetical protein
VTGLSGQGGSGYVLYDEVSEVLPGDIGVGATSKTSSPAWMWPASRSWKSPRISTRSWRKPRKLLDLDLPAGVGEKVNDPVRMYLREMGTVPLLTREGEVEIARRIERGQNTVLKSLSRAPLVIQEIIGWARRWRATSSRRATWCRSPIPSSPTSWWKRSAGIRRMAEEIARHYRKIPCSAGRSCRPFRAP